MVRFEHSIQHDCYYITIYDNNNYIGKLLFDDNTSSLLLDEYDLNKNLNSNKIYIATLIINKRYTKKGYGNKLMNYFIEYCNKKYQNPIIFLEAHPQFEQLSLTILIMFYEKFGFVIKKLNNESALMIKNG